MSHTFICVVPDEFHSENSLWQSRSSDLSTSTCIGPYTVLFLGNLYTTKLAVFSVISRHHGGRHILLRLKGETESYL